MFTFTLPTQVHIHFGFFHEHLSHFKYFFLGTPWAYLFSSMEAAKNEYPALSDYSVSETTLEQVFLSFAKDQRKLPGDQ